MDIKQIHVPLEEISYVVEAFEQAVISAYDFYNNPFCEIQHRGIGINNAFQEEIHRSDDEIFYYLKNDNMVATLIIRRTEFNNAEITMIATDEK
jgi:hypothetical protein